MTTVLAEFPAIAAAYLFGSALSDGPVGDVDLGLIQAADAEVPSAGDMGRLSRRIHEASALPPPPLDLRRMTPDQFDFVHEVLRSGELIYESDVDARVSLEVDAERRYLDIAWLRDYYRVVRDRMTDAS